jgi:hypothetical protein
MAKTRSNLYDAITSKWSTEEQNQRREFGIEIHKFK